MTLDSKDNDEVKRHVLDIEARLDRLSVSPQLSFEEVTNKHGSKPMLLGVKGWDKTKGEQIWDQEV